MSSKTLTLAKIIAGMMNLPKQTGEARHGCEPPSSEENQSQKTVQEVLYLE